MQGVPATFKIADENYRFEIGSKTKVEVLAENAPDGGKEPHPSVWLVKDRCEREHGLQTDRQHRLHFLVC